ncbi:endolytic transglycosylase MltG [Streptomyces sp. Tu 2975]|uniref:endolytic transglycosylase MltG n=1 Tax=Streptomyces sp. Tu 2975 TaxID=2676871 RepID=UPI0013597156|nr:endolytic transglycosylase MltG [Streptomyces sp. Tu 2975]QIP87446.1 endolytic transglycosylase MltG [Streptomyces sp. Tu 2975]
MYGDQGWGGQQPAAGHAPYAGEPQQQYPQDQYQQGQQYQEGQQGQQGQQYQYGQDQYGQGQYDTGQGQYDTGQGQYDTGQGQYHDPYRQGGQQQYQDPYGQQPQNQQQQPYDGGGWDTGQHSAVPYGTDPSATYGGEPAGYTTRQEADYYGTPDAYPPPQPPARRRAEPEPATDWDAEAAKEETHPFFTGDDGRDEDDGYDDEARGGGDDGGRDRRGKPKTKKKGGRNGLACLVVAAVLAGGLGAVGYFGYQFWQGQFGEAPDFSGTGVAETVEVTIPKGAGGYEIGGILKEKGVVKSVEAFVSAQTKNPKGPTIQDGVYLLKKEQSAESAVESMLNPASRNNLTIPEGTRNAAVYTSIDKKLKLKPGTTESVAETRADNLGLPDWAKNHKDVKDPLEGFLFPAAYPVSRGDKPEAILKKMVARANQEYEKAGLESKAKGLGLESPWELLTLASLVQVEGKTEDDFRKMSEVIYNRLKPENTETNQLLQFDSAFNYLKGQSKIDISEDEINSNQDPYNTYTQRGLTPGPISNPGNEALTAALNPTDDGWLYFVATDGMNKTEFAKTLAEHQKLVDKFNDSRGN